MSKGSSQPLGELERKRCQQSWLWPSYSLVAKLWLSQTLPGGLAQCSPLSPKLYLAFTP